jgi:hypothetical protein
MLILVAVRTWNLTHSSFVRYFRHKSEYVNHNSSTIPAFSSLAAWLNPSPGAAVSPRYAFRLQVKPPFSFGPNISAIKLPARNYFAATGAKAKVSGWGHSQVVQASAAFMSQNKALANWKARKQVSFTSGTSERWPQPCMMQQPWAG